MATSKMPTTATKSMESSNTRTSRLPHGRMVQNFLLLWLDARTNEVNDDDCRNSITKLRQIVNTVHTFTNTDECIEFINGIKEERIFLISSGAFGQTTIPIVHDKPQLSTIYIFCGNKSFHEKWARQWAKVKGVYTDIKPICEAVKKAAQDCDQNMISISFVQSSNDGTSKENLNELDQSFMYTQILKEILISIDFKQEHIDEFLTYCQEQFAGNDVELENVKKLRKEYRHHKPIWWYTYDCFLYSMLNRALRVMDVELIIKMGFFVRDLHQHIAVLHSEQYTGQNHSDSFTVYRGQGLSSTDFEQLMKTQGGLLSFNNFLSTSKNHEVSLDFARRTMTTSNLIGILFVMKIDPSISTVPFASVSNVSYFQSEEEILFSMHSIFRIGQVKQIEGNNRLWQVDLILTSDTDPQLHALSKQMSKETAGSTGWHRLGQLMIDLGQLNKAGELYEILLRQTTDEGEKARLFNQLGWVKNDLGDYAEAVTLYEKALEIQEKILSPNHPELAASYNSIGLTYYNMNDCSKALSYHKKALEIKQKIHSPNHPTLAISYNNLGMVYDKMKEYSEALLHYEKALEIKQKTLPPNHPHLTNTYNNIGGVYFEMREYSKALSYFEKTLNIDKKILPPKHPSLATSYNNIGSLYYSMGEHSKALPFFEEAVDILQRSVPETHPHLRSARKYIESIKRNT